MNKDIYSPFHPLWHLPTACCPTCVQVIFSIIAQSYMGYYSTTMTLKWNLNRTTCEACATQFESLVLLGHWAILYRLLLHNIDNKMEFIPYHLWGLCYTTWFTHTYKPKVQPDLHTIHIHLQCSIWMELPPWKSEKYFDIHSYICIPVCFKTRGTSYMWH